MIGILSDAHGNLEAFDRGLNILKEAGLRKFIFLGDAVGYLPGTGVIDRIFELRDQFTCIQGNHDVMLTSKLWNSERAGVYKHSETLEKLSAEKLEFVNSWKITFEISTDLGTALFVHGGPDDPLNQCIYPDSSLEKIKSNHTFLFMGHTHRPFIRTNGSRIFVNAGSCGLPRDNGALGSICIFDEINGSANIIRYDITDIIRKVIMRNDVHNDVKNVLRRRTKHYFGKLNA